ncbi:MAG: hypothetical protein EBV71_06155, partial [Chitinophagia bacterium]|nr:hypothetical protein [Chitinophagia bacterium]
MRKNNRSLSSFLLVSLIVLFSGVTQGQTKDTSTRYLSIDELTALVLKYHPVAQQASIQIGQAQANLRIARGAFDPIASFKSAEKTFDA